MNLPVHRSELLSRGKIVGKYLYINSWAYGQKRIEIWKRFCWFWYIHQETRFIDPPKIKRNKI